MEYIDRGDTPVWDFSTVASTLNPDGAWHKIDLSSIVPIEAANHPIHIKIAIAGIAKEYFKVRKAGYSEEVNSLENQVQNDKETDIFCVDEGLVACNEEREIEYILTGKETTTAMLVVRGWFE